MKEYRRGSHSVFQLRIHIVWCTKYLQKVMKRDVGLGLRELSTGGNGCRHEAILPVAQKISRMRGLKTTLRTTQSEMMSFMWSGTLRHILRPP